MRLASLPIAVVMERRHLDHPWADTAWHAIGVVIDRMHLPPLQTLALHDTSEIYCVSGLALELYPDENDGYFENWIAPSPKVFVMWQMRDDRAMPMLASVSYSEGARMLDSGESADGVPMPPDIHAWLGDYLRKHYQPRARRGREHG